MADLLLEIGCEELPAWACREAEQQLPGLVREHLGADPARVLVGPRRLAVIVEGVPAETAPEWVKGPPVNAPEQAREGFARKHGLEPAQLAERDGVLGVERPGRRMAEVLPERLAAIVTGLQFRKTMVVRPGGLRFPRPVRWLVAKLDAETIPLEAAGLRAGAVSYGHRFTHGEVEIPDTGAYLGRLRSAAVEPDQEERRRQIRAGLDRLGAWSDPAGKLDEVVHLVENVTVLEGSFDERFLDLPEQVVTTAMQSHQRYFPLGGNRFGVVVNGGDPEVARAGHENVLRNRLDDARFTFERDVAKGIEGLRAELGAITFFAGAGSFADKSDRLVGIVSELGGDATAREAARLAKADQAAELVREFADLEGAIGAHYARLAGVPEEVCVAIAEQYLPDGADRPLPSTEAGRLLSAADRIDTLRVSFGLGHRPTGSRDPYGLRRAAIGVCRLALEGGVPVRRDLFDGELRDFVEERLEGLVDVPVEFVRASRPVPFQRIDEIAANARDLALLHDRLGNAKEIYERARRIVADRADDAPVDAALLTEDEKPLLAAITSQPEPGVRVDRLVEWADSIAPVVEKFFVDVLVMDPDERIRANRFRLLRDLRDALGRLADLSLIPL